MFTGTNVYGPLFICVALILLSLVGWIFYEICRNYSKYAEQNPKRRVSLFFGHTILILVIGTVYVVSMTLLWNILQSVTTNSSTYKSAAELREQKQVSEAQLPTKDEIDQNRLDLKQRAEVKPHENALDSFDEKMRQVDEKIRNRSITQPSKNTVEKP